MYEEQNAVAVHEPTESPGSLDAFDGPRELNRALISVLSDPLFELDERGVCTGSHIPAGVCQPFLPGDFVGKKIEEVLPPSIARLMRQAMQRVHSSGKADTIEYCLGQENVSPRSFEARFVSGGAGGFLCMVREVTERKQLEEALRRNEERLQQEALHDSLTGLPNRRQFLGFLDKVLTRLRHKPDHCAAVLFLDVDRFKEVNDGMGHAAGDELLIQFARRLEKGLRAGDLIARFGGDEFGAVLSGLDNISGAVHVAERMLKEAMEPFCIAGREVVVGSSVGITLASTGFETPEVLLRDADIAMYRAKRNGRGRFEVFDSTMHREVLEKLEMEAGLRKALEREEFVLDFQPIVDLAKEQVIAFEALLRWQHPQRGLLYPCSFLDLAEEAGLMGPIGEWVFEKAAEEHANWSRETATVSRLCVNFSSRQLRDKRLREVLPATLERFGTSPGLIDIELTITRGLVRDAEAQETLRWLSQRGMALIMDDSGRSTSWIGRIGVLPVRAVKVHPSVLSLVPTNETTGRMLTAVLAGASILDLEVVVQGVETEEQLRFLETRGCRFAQGFLFSRGLPAREVSDFLSGWPEQARRLFH